MVGEGAYQVYTTAMSKRLLIHALYMQKGVNQDMNARHLKITGIALLVLLLALLTASLGFAEGETTSYEVTITNLTSGQPFTPPVIATHRPSTGMFTVGQPASFELKEIAENGNLAPMVMALENDKHVSNFVVAVAGDPPPLLPGQSVTVSIDESLGGKYLSFASMLICTNDGFTGLDTVRLPQVVGETLTFTADAYDAGTEINTEDFADMVPPCPLLTGVPSDDPGTGMSDPALAENGVIHHHDGIQGIADLDPEIHDWENPVVEIEITRVN